MRLRGRRLLDDVASRARRAMTRLLIAMPLIIAMGRGVWGANGGTGAAFLKIGVGARAAGMGSAFTAGADDVSSIYWNPAGLARLENREVSATHTEWLTDMRYDFVGAAIPTSVGNIGMSAVYLSQGKLERRDDSGNLTGGFAAFDAAATLSYARTISPGTRLGVNAKYIQQSIDTAKAAGMAFDAGTQMAVGRFLSLGLAAGNVGPRLKFLSEAYHLPMNISAGFALTPFKGMTLSGDLRREVYEHKINFNLGTEYWFMDRLALRAGYQAPLGSGSDRAAAKKFSGPGASPLTAFSGLGMGVGFRLAGFQVDYAMVPYGDLGNTQRLTFSSKF